MKRIQRLFGALCLAVLLNGCAAHTQMIEPAPGRSSLALRGDAWLSSEDGSFAVRIPEGWRTKEEPGSGSILLTRGADARDGLIVVRSFPTLVSPTADALSQVKQGVIEGLQAETASFQLAAQETLEVNGRSAFQVRYRYELQRTPVVGYLTVVVGDSALYSVSVVAPREHARAAELAVRSVLATLRIDERPDRAVSFADPDGRFSLELPAGWTVQDSLARHAAGQYFHTFAAGDGSHSVLTVARLENSSIDPASAREVVGALDQGLLSKLGARIDRQLDIRRTELGGRPAILRIATLRAGEQTFYLCETVQVGEGEVTAVVAYGPRSWYEAHRPTLEAVLTSFRFQGTKNPGAVASR